MTFFTVTSPLRRFGDFKTGASIASPFIDPSVKAGMLEQDSQGFPVTCFSKPKPWIRKFRTSMLVEERTMLESWYTSYFFRNKTFYLLLNFVKPHNISAHSDNFYNPEKRFLLNVFWMSWNFVRFHKILNQTDAENFSFLSWQAKKFYS